jgi:hypothetical protein
MNWLLKIIVISCILSSCSSKDKNFCDCMKASDDFNRINQEILSGNKKRQKIDKAKRLLKIKKNRCDQYRKTLGPEMLEKKKDCQ